MTNNDTARAIIIGAGPNGLAAAITLAQAGISVKVIDKNPLIGGAVRSAELTLPGYIHDIGAAVCPLAVASPFFRKLPQDAMGSAWIRSPISLAHPFDDGSVALLFNSIEETAETLEKDSSAYTKLMNPIVDDWDGIADELLGTFRFTRHPISLIRFALKSLQSAMRLTENLFVGEKAKGFMAGLAAHSILPMEKRGSATFGVVLAALGHIYGWPIAAGGSQSISDGLAKHLRSLGGTIETGHLVRSIDELPSDKTILLNVTPRQIVNIAGNYLPGSYVRQLMKYHYGPGVFKIDWALNSPIPWSNKECLKAASIHIGGTIEEIASSERSVWKGEHPEKPFVILVQPSLFDSTRAPEGKHTAWAYCHVPNSSTYDMTSRIEAQIERFAPGFQEVILARSVMNTAMLEYDNPNLVGGDITGGAQELKQLIFRPTPRIVPYSTPLKNLFICSAATPPGAGVHGMCGFHAAQACLQSLKLPNPSYNSREK